MKKKIVSCLMLIGVVILAYFYANIDKNVYLYKQDLEVAQMLSTGILQTGDTLAQSFVGEENTIDGLNIKIALVGDVNNVTLHCKVLDSNSNEMAVASVSGSELENNKFYQLKIPTVKDTKGKQYTLVLSEEGADAQNGISFYVDPTVRDAQQMTISNQEMQGNLVARAICHRFDVETFLVVLAMIAFVVTFMKILYKMFK